MSAASPPAAPCIGLGLYPTRPAGEIVRLGVRAEALDYDRVWILDSPVSPLLDGAPQALLDPKPDHPGSAGRAGGPPPA